VGIVGRAAIDKWHILYLYNRVHYIHGMDIIPIMLIKIVEMND